MGRTMLVWALGSGVPVLGILLAAAITLMLRNLTPTQFTVAVMILALFALLFGSILMWIVSWLTATPVRVVRAALNRVEEGNLDTNLVVFDGTELGQLQRGFNSMVARPPRTRTCPGSVRPPCRPRGGRRGRAASGRNSAARSATSR